MATGLIRLGLSLSGQDLSRTDQTVVVQGQSAAVSVVLEPDGTWGSLDSLYMRFHRSGSLVYDVAIEDNEALVPHEVTEEAGSFDVCVWGESSEGTTLPSDPVTVTVASTIIGTAGDPEAPTPSVLQQIKDELAAKKDSDTTYELTKSGSTITLTGSDGTATSVSDSDTTYELPPATADELGGVKVGDGLTVTVDGVLSATDYSSGPIWDEDAGRYTDDSIAAMLAKHSDGLMYGCSQPKGSATELTKLGANAAISAPTPGTGTTQAMNPYAGLGPFFYLTVNGTVDADGTPHVTAIKGDGHFASDGSNGDVWTLAPTLWTRQVETDDAVETWLSDSYLPGYSTQPGGLLADGTRRRFMLYAAYPGVKGEDGLMHSYSGYPVWTRSTSHNTLATQTNCATTGLSGKTAADDWYVKTMYRLMFATKSNPSVMPGCISYDYGYAPALAEEGVNRIVLTTAQAANFVVGSSVMLGTGNGDGTSIGRGGAKAYDVFDARRITAIEAVDDANSALIIEGDAFDTLTTDRVQTAPWHSGACDGVLGGLGCPTDYTSTKEPFVIQGIELMHGAYEILHNVILENTGGGWSVLVCRDTQTSAVNATSAYEDTGLDLPTDDADSWKYPLYDVEAGGMLVPQGTGGSTSTGLCDGCYTNKLATTGTREWLSLGGLAYGGVAGLSFVRGYYGLSYAWWRVSSRLSGNGRSRG